MLLILCYIQYIRPICFYRALFYWFICRKNVIAIQLCLFSHKAYSLDFGMDKSFLLSYFFLLFK